ncbi:MAG: hypothetical protein ACI9Y1_001369 [Lentisphaeria bacterium]|jgi:hypothetical protein
MFDPDKFQINEAWIIFKLNDAPVSTKADGDFNVLALMDAGSCFILGTEFVGTNSLELSELGSKRLLKSGYSHKNQFPKKILIPANQTVNVLIKEAEQQGITVLRVSDEDLLVFVHEARQGFQEHANGSQVQ